VTHRPHRVLRLPATLATAMLGVALVSGCGSSSAPVPANSSTNVGSSTSGGGRTHAARIDPCSILTASEISAALGYAVAVAVKGSNPFGVTAPFDGPTFVAGGVITACNYFETQPKDVSSGPRQFEVTILQRDFSQPSSHWNADSAKTQFDHIRSFNTPNQALPGFGDSAISVPSGVLFDIYVLYGDLVLIAGRADQLSVDTSVMRKLLARV
jgi:hypothetical protein